jgi:hypothetical protein
VQSQILRPNFRSLAALAIMLAAAAILALVLLTTLLYNAPVTSRPAVAPAAPTVQHYVEPDAADRIEPVVSAVPAGDANPDSNLPICKRHGGPTC